MRKNTVGIVSAVVLAALPLASTPSYAAETTPSLQTLASQAGILPTSPFYGLKRFGESVELLLTFSATGKAQLLSYLATVRSAEAAAMIETKHPKEAEQALSQYAVELSQADKLLASLAPRHRDAALAAAVSSAASDGMVVTQHVGQSRDRAAATQASQVALAETTLSTPLGSGQASGAETPLSAGSPDGLNLLASAVASASHQSLSQVMALYQTSHNWTQVVAELHISLGAVLNALASQLASSLPSGTPASSTPTSPTATSNPTPTLTTSASTSGSVATPPTSAPVGSVPTSASQDSHQAPESSHPPESQAPETQAPEAEGSVFGTVSSMSGTAITVNGTSYPLAAAVAIHYHDWNLTGQPLPQGTAVKLSVTNGTVDRIEVLSDPALPQSQTVRGIISQFTSTTLTIDGYTLTLAPSVAVTYHDYQLSVSRVPSGVPVKVNLNQAGQVARIKLESDPALPSGNSFTGPVAAAAPGQLAVGPYTLPVAAGVIPAFHGQPFTSAIQPGWIVKVHLDASGTVISIKIESGPTLPSRSSSGDN